MPKTKIDPNAYYAVKIGKQPGIYPCWEKGAKEQIQGFKGAVYKKFKTQEEAREFMDKRNVTTETVGNERKYQQLMCKKLTNAFKTGTQLLLDKDITSSYLAIDNDKKPDKKPDKKYTSYLDPQIAQDLIESQPTSEIHISNWNYHMGQYYLFTDGSLMAGSHVGYGICISNGNTTTDTLRPPICISRVMPEGTTNNQCEMLAIVSALHLAYIFKNYFGTKDNNRQIQYGKNLTIVSDSQYCINAVSKWIKQWQKNGWTTAVGKPVKNREILEKINNLLTILKPYVNVTFLHQNSHLPTPPANASTINKLLWEGNYLVDLAAKNKY